MNTFQRLAYMQPQYPPEAYAPLPGTPIMATRDRHLGLMLKSGIVYAVSYAGTPTDRAKKYEDFSVNNFEPDDGVIGFLYGREKILRGGEYIEFERDGRQVNIYDYNACLRNFCSVFYDDFMRFREDPEEIFLIGKSWSPVCSYKKLEPYVFYLPYAPTDLERRVWDGLPYTRDMYRS